MKKISAILLTSTSILSATAVYADGPSMDDPFFWIGGEAGNPEQTDTAPTKGQAKPRNPILDDYPTDDAPANMKPENGSSIMADDGCSYPEQAPATMDFATSKPTTGERGVSPHDKRRGEMAGDDGVLTAIQDAPCFDPMRRGGETASSMRGHLRDGDIQRVNTLEERRIPTHSVGRYAPDGSGLWYRDPANPFVDAAAEWDVRTNETLSQLLHRWADDAGFTVVYQADTDFVLQADVIIRGTFAEAAGQVIESFANANPAITADYYLGNKVIVVRSANEFDGR